MACFRPTAEGIVLSVRLTPRAHHDGLDGIGALGDGREVALMRVRAAPDSGAANAALVDLVARLLGRPKSAVTVARGTTQRLKQVVVSGEASGLAAVIATWPRTGRRGR